MSSNRLIYDNCAYSTEIKESISPLQYNLFKVSNGIGGLIFNL